MTKALFPGTFDPPTLGHLDIIQRAANLYDQLYIAIANNSSKHPLFTLAEKQDLLSTITSHLKNVKIVTFSGLVAEFAKSMSVNILIRGLRNTSDFDYEYQMASSNCLMTGIETVFLMSAPQYIPISATLIREIAKNGHRLHGFIPEAIEEMVFKHITQQRI